MTSDTSHTPVPFYAVSEFSGLVSCHPDLFGMVIENRTKETNPVECASRSWGFGRS